jgi:histidyl-tRNA synthetase
MSVMKLSELKPVRGMRDFLPKDAQRIRYVEQEARNLSHSYSFQEVITPVVESYELLAAKAGEEIRHRMYQFTDLSNRKIALRAEFTPSIARLVATKFRTMPKPLRLFCVGSLYRYDEPQFGRYREFWQANYELMGSDTPEADVEIISITSNFLEKIGLKNNIIKIGHVGILRGIMTQENIKEELQNQIMQLLDKKQWNDALQIVQNQRVSQKCLDTIKGVLETRGKNITETLLKIKKEVEEYETSTAATENLERIIELAQQTNVKSEMIVDAGFARGLEYYTGMIIESYVPELERADLALGGGGRYDKLIELFGGEPTPAVGVALGIDRIALAMKKQKTPSEFEGQRRVLIIPIKQEMMRKAFEISNQLHESGIISELAVMRRKVSSALSDADRRGFTSVVLIGPEEEKEGKAILRDMKRRDQEAVEISELAKKIMKME